MPPRRRPPPAGARTDLPPLKIVRKIVLLQLAYYASATILILFTTLVYGTAFSFDLVFSWDALRGDTTIGWVLGLVWMLNSVLGVIFLLLFVARSKLIPDFALTLHFLHLVATTLYTHSLPTNWLWWGLQCASAALMIFLGMWACQWRELRPISFGGIGGKSSDRQQPRGSSETQAGENGQLSRGRDRERSQDGSNEYEMAEMKGTGEQAV
ncbi:hypothetical protein EYZ11_003745 [Aspergillus tanneri]|uniref:Integral membrane protein of the Golgi n=1 Tax=Aspergillus tanneri TaxID=1220188 RepID=A0A4S3JMX2_9EURO|nr:uncharacterized protein ATNIH1004_007509 [Aspergillus tanneri]KAA8646086.1 hypothetical protein ATNIH1004_007509 [Aspergillus tanneri]THC96780.1 hypothetical protein EYZ11_003745 [Aspergillus tanneri]